MEILRVAFDWYQSGKQLVYRLFCQVESYGFLKVFSWGLFIVTFSCRVAMTVINHFSDASVFEENEPVADEEIILPVHGGPLDHFIERRLKAVNLRRWMSIKIVCPLLNNVHFMNSRLRYSVYRDVQLGVTPLKRLRQIAADTNFVSNNFRDLPRIVECLSLTNNQVHFMARLDALKEGVFLDRFQGGFSEMAGIDFPSDSAILFHLFLIYMNEFMSPQVPNDKHIFTNKYVIYNSNFDREDAICSNDLDLAIHCSDKINPKFRLYYRRLNIHSATVFEVIVNFLLHVKSLRRGYLEGSDLNGILQFINAKGSLRSL